MLRSKPKTARRGVILIVVLGLLTILTLIGLAFLFSSRDSAQTSSIRGASGNNVEFTEDGSEAFNYFLSSLIYGVPDSGQGLHSALRGHELTRDMYGGQIGSADAFAGIGTFHETVTINGTVTLPRAAFLNYRIVPGQTGNWVDPERSGVRAANAAITGQYIPKNAAYTYADGRCAYLAVVAPTGEVLLPSFVRPNLSGGFGTLNPSNPNWRSDAGVFTSVRPTQRIHPNFPFVPPNADPASYGGDPAKLYTGDVQNLRGSYYRDPTTNKCYALNDSVFIDIGLPPIRIGDKLYKPMAAPLIVDLNGRLNLSMHGNNMATGGGHTSGQGIGSWEVNLTKILGVDAPGLIGARGTPQTLSGPTSKRFDERNPAVQLHQHSAVAWTGGGGTRDGFLNLPGLGGNPLFANGPTYAPTYDPGPYTAGYDNMNAAALNHPALFNPNEWPTLANGVLPRSFPASDVKRLAAKWGAEPAFYSQMVSGAFAPNSLRGGPPTYPVPFPNPPGQTDLNGYRNDPAHLNRQSVTPYAFQLDRSILTPGQGQTQAAYAALGGTNLNRSLADHRNNPNLPLGAGNNAPATFTLGTAINLQQAQIDRQLFARDIFARLLAATGATGATINADGSVTITEPLATPESATYIQLRQLAQLAVNIVDYIDNDDVMSPFVWNSANPADPLVGFDTFTPTVINSRVVFGTEKPRLVLNEAYIEYVNDPNDNTFSMAVGAANAPLVRAWFELHNPTNTPYAGTGGVTNPLGDGAVNVYYSAGAGDGSTHSPYRVEIVRHAAVATGAATELQTPSNVTGLMTNTPDLVWDFSAAGATAQRRVAPTNNNPAGGILVCAADTATPRGAEFVNPAGWTVAGGFNILNGTVPGGATPLTYAYTPGLAAIGVDLKRHVVALRRLANPYRPFNASYNPYITVDYVDHVPAYDALIRSNGSMNDRTAKTWNGTAVQPGYDPTDVPAAGDPIIRRRAHGKVQPYAGLCVPGAVAANTEYPAYSFPTSMVLDQRPVDGMGATVTGVRHTFFRQNSMSAAPPVAATFVPGPPASLAGNDTLMTPYDWLVHLDRPLINQLELLHVTAGKPHDLTQQFMTTNAGAVNKFVGSAQTVILNNSIPQLYRALELLRVEPKSHQMALGGRVAGPINLNTITDKRVWDALFDAQAGNGFDQAFVDALWAQMIATRTPNMAPRSRPDGTPLAWATPIPGVSVYDTNNGTGDRPFLPLGAATVPPQAGGYPLPGGATALGGGTGINDTILRLNPGTSLPWLTVPGAHPYQNAEAARKILNNTTGVSNTFAVWVTIGYFEATEVTSAVPGERDYVLGKMYYKEVPGDSLFRFFAVIDRTNVGLEPASYAGGTFTHFTGRPFFTTVEANAVAGTNTLQVATSGDSTVYSNGQPVNFTAGSVLVVGVGTNREIVTVSGTGYNAATSVTTVTLAAPLAKNHTTGECFANVVPGNPGPQTGFSPSKTMYQPVVPFATPLP